VAIDEVFAGSAQDDLPGYADLGILFEADGGLLLVAIVEDDSDACFCYSCLSTFVDEILMPSAFPRGRRGSAYLEILRPDCGHVRDTQNETY
jgi:hypothetical protein